MLKELTSFQNNRFFVFEIVIVAEIDTLFIYLFIHYLQLGRHPVAGVVTSYISTDCEDFTLKFRYMRSM